MNRHETFANVDLWVLDQDFWKSDASEWADIFERLSEKGFTFDESRDIIEAAIGLVSQEYGD